MYPTFVQDVVSFGEQLANAEKLRPHKALHGPNKANFWCAVITSKCVSRKVQDTQLKIL